MSEHAQINIVRGDEIVRIHSGWGHPANMVPALRKAAALGLKKSQTIATKFMDLVEDGSFGLSIVKEDVDRNMLNFFYTVDVSKTPWTVKQTRMPGYKIITRPDGTGYPASKMTPARSHTITLAAAK